MEDGARTASRAEDRRIVVESIGTAGPAAAAAVAKGLGIPVSRAVACLYRAPAVLADEVPSETADEMVRLLERIGFSARAESRDAPPPRPNELLDVALHVADVGALHDAAEALGVFTASDAGAALEMILAPPGLVLGAVSAATVEALRARLPEGVELVAARPETSRYHVFLLDGPPVVRERLMPDLARLGVSPDAQPGLVAMDLPHEAVRDLWRVHQAGGMVRVVNTAFLRFDVVLVGAGGADPDDPAVADALAEEAGMPADAVAAVLGELPVTLSEGVGSETLAERLERLTAVGLEVRAELTTFQQLGLEVQSARVPGALAAVLRRFGLLAEGDRSPACPFVLDRRLPELQARVLRAALEDAGAEVAWLEGSA